MRKDNVYFGSKNRTRDALTLSLSVVDNSGVIAFVLEKHNESKLRGLICVISESSSAYPKTCKEDKSNKGNISAGFRSFLIVWLR